MIFRSKNRFLITFLTRGVLLHFSQASNIEVLNIVNIIFLQILRIKCDFLASMLPAALEDIFCKKIKIRCTKLNTASISEILGILSLHIKYSVEFLAKVQSYKFVDFVKKDGLFENYTFWKCYLNTLGYNFERKPENEGTLQLTAKGGVVFFGTNSARSNHRMCMHTIPYLVSVTKKVLTHHHTLLKHCLAYCRPSDKTILRLLKHKRLRSIKD